MRAAFLATAVAAIGTTAAAPTAEAATVHGVPLPRRSRALGDTGLHFISGLGFRKTVSHFQRHFRRRGVKVKEIPVYGYRGVIVSRFLAAGPSPWLAVHVFRHDGRTHIYVVPRPTRPAPVPKPSKAPSGPRQTP